ncbi:hypothetical protein EPI10_030130 [Gossypium australe]|uniref:Reverse transcriptase n=1 Tax=Gossypium australe TaxID=47621 RepID=A0A5B6WZT1_9ROSI|nr:hypothetical protein EPI10_030130 [Gossypium australe]
MDYDVEERVLMGEEGKKKDIEVKANGCQKASRPTAMKILSWNVRGLGNPQTIRRLRYTLKLHSPNSLLHGDKN